MNLKIFAFGYIRHKRLMAIQRGYQVAVNCTCLLMVALRIIHILFALIVVMALFKTMETYEKPNAWSEL